MSLRTLCGDDAIGHGDERYDACMVTLALTLNLTLALLLTRARWSEPPSAKFALVRVRFRVKALGWG